MKHNHNAASTGRKGEKKLKEFFERNKLTILNTMYEYEEYYTDKDLARKMYNETKKLASCLEGHNGYFNSDGWCPELETIIELKYGEKHGTTEEKIYFDLIKIKKGVYGDKYKLLYIFMGTVENKRGKTSLCHAEFFKTLAAEESLPVEIVFATKNNGLQKWIEAEKTKRSINEYQN